MTLATDFLAGPSRPGRLHPDRHHVGVLALVSGAPTTRSAAGAAATSWRRQRAIDFRSIQGATVGPGTMPGTAIMAYCSPRPRESSLGGFSSGSWRTSRRASAGLDAMVPAVGGCRATARLGQRPPAADSAPAGSTPWAARPMVPPDGFRARPDVTGTRAGGGGAVGSRRRRPLAPLAGPVGSRRRRPLAPLAGPVGSRRRRPLAPPAGGGRFTAFTGTRAAGRAGRFAAIGR